MNNDFEALWQAQPVVEHDSKRLTKMWKKRRWKDLCSHGLAIVMIPVAIWFGIDTGTSDSHWAVKAWVIFWMVFSCIGFIASLWFMRRSVLTMRDASNHELMAHMRHRAEFQLKQLKIWKPSAVLMAILLALFNVVYLSTSPIEDVEWHKFILKDVLVLGIAYWIWKYAVYKQLRFKKELAWLNDYEQAGEGAQNSPPD